MVSLFAPIVWDLTWLFSLTLLVCSVLLWLRTQPARNMSQMRSLLARAAAVPTYQGQLSQLEHELKRARRYQHSFSVIVLMLEPSYDAAGMSDHSAQMARIAMIPVMVCLVRETLRETDVLTYDAALNRCIVATAGSSGDAAQLVSRLCAFFQRRSFELRAGVAEFPVDGPTMEVLVDKAQLSCDRVNSGPPHPFVERLPESTAERVRHNTTMA